MHDVNGWLMTLSFLGGLILTAALMMRRVTREVPLTHTLSAAAGGRPDSHATGGKAPDLGKVAAGAGAALHGAAEKVGEFVESVGDKIEGLFERDTHGSGSARLTPRKVAPAGYTVKFDPDSKRYYLPGTAAYDALETEWWFIDAVGYRRGRRPRRRSGRFRRRHPARTARQGLRVGGGGRQRSGRLADQGQCRLDALPPAGQSLLRADRRRGVVLR